MDRLAPHRGECFDFPGLQTEGREATMVHLVTELRRIRRSQRHDRFVWAIAALLAGIALFLVISEFISGA